MGASKGIPVTLPGSFPPYPGLSGARTPEHQLPPYAQPLPYGRVPPPGPVPGVYDNLHRPPILPSNGIGTLPGSKP